MQRPVSAESSIGRAFLTDTVTVVNDTDFLDLPASALAARRAGILSFAHAPISIEGVV